MIKNIVKYSFLLLFISSCKKKEEKIQPIKEDITESVYASGVIKSKNQYQVFSTVNGIATKVFVIEGDMVSKGSPIIQLNNTTAQLNSENAKIIAEYSLQKSNIDKLNELKINVDLAKAKMENDALTFKRKKNLWEQEIGTKNDLDQLELMFKNSTTVYESAKLKLSDLQKQISFQEKQSQKNLQITNQLVKDFTIKSLYNGKVFSILKKEGEMVNVQAPVAIIGDANSFYIELQVDEYDIAKIKIGQQVFLHMDSYKDEVFEARVSKINPMMNERSKSFMIEATFELQPKTLYPFLTCEANILIKEKKNAITIPSSYLQVGNYVLLENEEKKKVEIGLKNYEKTEITNGLSTSDFIIKPR